MLQFFKGRKFKIFLLVFTAVFLGTVLAFASKNATTPATGIVSVIVSPFEKAGSYLSNAVGNAADYFKSSASYKAENERLKQKIAEYENQLSEYEDAKEKLSSYETMLGIKEDNPDFKFQRGRIIGSDSMDVFSSIIIDRGSSDDVAVGDPVISGNYLVGVVKKVHSSYSVVETILNPSINISAIESKTREISFVTTDTEKALAGLCYMTGLDRTTAITPGEIILTSGVGGIYPKGLIIGTVTEIGENKFELSSFAIIEPGVNPKELEDVYVITDFKGQGVEEIID